MTRPRRRGSGRTRWWVAALSLLVGSVAAGCVGLVHASGHRDALALFDSGAFAAAYELAQPVDTGEAQLLAARSAIAVAIYEAASSEDELAWLERGLSAARRATELTPESPWAWLDLAHARGEIALRSDALRNLDVAGELRDVIERALALDPDHPNALVALGMWHVELTERGVGWLYGAHSERGLALVERGVALAPRELDLRIEYARALQLQGEVAGAREQLEIALGLPARTAVERYQRERAKSLLEAIEGS